MPLRTIFLAIILSTIYNFVFAQLKIIEVDSLTGATKDPLPFDEPFLLKIPTNTTRVKGVSYLQHFGKKDFGQSYRIQKNDKWLFGQALRKIPEKDVQVRKVGGINYLLIYVRNPNLLSPGKRYSFFWAEDVTPTVLTMFNQYHKFRDSSNVKAKEAAQKLYKQLATEVQKTFNYPLNFPSEPTDLTSLSRLREIYDDSELKLNEDYRSLYQGESSYNNIVKRSRVRSLLVGNDSLVALAKTIVKRSTNFDVELRLKYLADVPKSTARLYRLYSLADTSYHHLLNGLESIDCQECKPVHREQYEARQNNLASSLVAINELLYVSKLLDKLTPSVQTKALQALGDELKKGKKVFDQLAIIQQTIKRKLFNQALSNLTTLNGNTFAYSFDVRSKLSIAPDFGVVTTRISNDGSNPYPFVPYLGFHVNLRPINRDIPFRSYKHTIWHRTSLMVGWSLVSIDNGPKLQSGADSVTSFFAKGKGTLLSGVGIRLSNALRLTGGVMWHFKYSINNAIPAAYDSRQLQVWPFVGLSLDLSLKDLLNGITDVFSGAPRRFVPQPPPDIAN